MVAYASTESMRSRPLATCTRTSVSCTRSSADQPVGDGDEQVGELGGVELLGGGIRHVIGDTVGPESRDRVGERQRDALARFGLHGRGGHSAHLLSGGEKRRLTLACIFALRPDILVMDEPTGMLDLPGRRDFRRLIDPLPQRILVATHDLELLHGFDRVLVLDGGRVHADADPQAAIDAYVALVEARAAADPHADTGSAAA